MGGTLAIFFIIMLKLVHVITFLFEINIRLCF